MLRPENGIELQQKKGERLRDRERQSIQDISIIAREPNDNLPHQLHVQINSLQVFPFLLQ